MIALVSFAAVFVVALLLLVLLMWSSLRQAAQQRLRVALQAKEDSVRAALIKDYVGLSSDQSMTPEVRKQALLVLVDYVPSCEAARLRLCEALQETDDGVRDAVLKALDNPAALALVKELRTRVAPASPNAEKTKALEGLVVLSASHKDSRPEVRKTLRAALCDGDLRDVAARELEKLDK